MTTTTNYQLPQWEATDPIQRADFNAAMEALDAGVAGAQTTANTARNEAWAAQNTAQAAYAAAQGAQTTADTARAEAAAAQATADTAREEVAALAAVEKVVTGKTVMGTDSSTSFMITFEEGAKLGIFWTPASTPAVAVPTWTGYMYLGSWNVLASVNMFTDSASISLRDTTQSHHLFYAIFY